MQYFENRKNPKFSDTYFAVNTRTRTKRFCQVARPQTEIANSVDPDQTDWVCTVCPKLSENLGSLQ